LKISIITIVYNRRDTIADAIESVLGQSYTNIEYIIVDGLSTDGTIEVIKSYGNRISKFVSEKDKSLYDAINKGINLATGDVIGLLHSDDVFYCQNSLALVAKAFKDNGTESVYADLLYVQKQNISKTVRKWISGNYNRQRFLRGWMPPHPTFYVKRDCFEKYGNYNTLFQSAADYELMLRFLYKHELTSFYLPVKLVKMRIGGKSNLSIINRIRANQEDYKAWVINGLEPHFYTRFLKPLRKLSQFF
jgi:glycosyltransferase involved in cell wall biosynthesis